MPFVDVRKRAGLRAQSILPKDLFLSWSKRIENLAFLTYRQASYKDIESLAWGEPTKNHATKEREELERSNLFSDILSCYNP